MGILKGLSSLILFFAVLHKLPVEGRKNPSQSFVTIRDRGGSGVPYHYHHYPETIQFPGEIDFSGSYHNRDRAVADRHHDIDDPVPGRHEIQGISSFYRHGQRPRTDEVPPALPLRCSGVCLHASQCASLSGTASRNCPGGSPNFVCCEFGNSCSQVSGEERTVFMSPGYPGPTLGNIICQFDIIVRSGTCAVRLDFLEFNTSLPLDRGLCNVDQLLVMNSIDGATFPRCGELTGYSTIVPVDARHKLPLTLLSIIQSSKEEYKWNIKITQIKCGVPPPVRDYPGCGKTFLTEADSSLAINKKKKGSGESGEKTTTIFPDIENVVFDDGDTEQIFFSKSSSHLKSTVPRQNNVDNAFYIAYLKQAYDAMTSSEGNETYCKNREEEIHAEKIEKLRDGGEDLGRIIRGDEAFVNEFPWQVSIQDEKGHICGGAIISPLFILTAAHCYMSIAPIPLPKVKVILGDLNFNLTTESREETVDVEKVIFHSHFDPYYLQNDILLIRLRKPIKFREGIQPVCLPEKGNSYTSAITAISGWGATSYPNGKLATVLHKTTNLKVIENSECQKKLKIDYLYESMMCAVAPNCSGTCYGDSGGPLTATTKVGGGDHDHGDTDKEESRNVLVGLVSFGIGGCAFLPDWPDIYTRVSSYLDWIAFAMYND